MAAYDDIPKFQALSYSEKWRVTRLVAKGEAPRNPRLAAAAVELAESYQRGRPKPPQLYRRLATAVILGATAVAIIAASKGDALVTMAMALVVLSNVLHLVLNPVARPERVARSLEASRQVSAAGQG